MQGLVLTMDKSKAHHSSFLARIVESMDTTSLDVQNLGYRLDPNPDSTKARSRGAGCSDRPTDLEKGGVAEPVDESRSRSEGRGS